jgi:hypothetical protein
MPDRLSICMPYFRNPNMMREHQRVWALWPEDLRARLTVCIGDDGSPDGDTAGEAAVEPDGYELRIYKLLKHIPWGSKGARNTAIWNAPEGWCLATDIDHCLDADEAEKLFDLELDEDCYYILGRKKPDGVVYHSHPNSYLLTRSMYWDKAGGANEDFDGWYGTDNPLRSRLEKVGKRVEMPDVKLTVLNLNGEDIGDVKGAATTDYGRKHSRWHTRLNPELVRKIDRDRLKRPERPLRREYERVL